MPCFTAPVKNHQPLMVVYVTAPAPTGEGGVADLNKGNGFCALVDTGATSSCISSRAAQKIGVDSDGKSKVMTAGGLVFANYYYVNLHIPVEVGVAKDDKPAPVSVKSFSRLRVGEAVLSEHYDVLLGMDVIMSGGLHVSGDSFTFCT